jgi:diguanylate cyclase (GGDEF)-like protein
VDGLMAGSAQGAPVIGDHKLSLQSNRLAAPTAPCCCGRQGLEIDHDRLSPEGPTLAVALCTAPTLAAGLAVILVWTLATEHLAATSPELERVLIALGWLALLASLALARWQYLRVARPLRLLGELGPGAGSRSDGLPRELALVQARLCVKEGRLGPERDRLTGLLSSTGLHEVAKLAVDAARGQGRRLVLAVIDVERLREINAGYSYTVGDEILRQLTRRLSAICPSGATIGRIGGDRFALLIPLSADQQRPEHWPQAILASLGRHFCVDGCELQLGVCLGSALFPDHGGSFQHLLRAAEQALETARRSEGRAWCQFDPGLNQAALQRRALEKELRRALEQNALTLHYQPQVDLTTGAIIGVEALLRWPHPEKGMIPPATFIPVAEASGLIRPLGAWVLVEAAQAARRWRDQGVDVGVSVNVSAAQLRRQDLVRLVEQVLDQTGLPPEALELELTESMFVDPTQIAMHRAIQGIAAMGVRLAIDDFGTGYSSLGYLKRLPVDKIKIDKSFVRELGRDETDAAIVRSVIGLARTFGKRVLAEGVEEASQFHFLKAEGCDEAQGYYFSRPMPEAACIGLLKRHLGAGEQAVAC